MASEVVHIPLPLLTQSYQSVNTYWIFFFYALVKLSPLYLLNNYNGHKRKRGVKCWPTKVVARDIILLFFSPLGSPIVNNGEEQDGRERGRERERGRKKREGEREIEINERGKERERGDNFLGLSTNRFHLISLSRLLRVWIHLTVPPLLISTMEMDPSLPSFTTTLMMKSIVLQERTYY